MTSTPGQFDPDGNFAILGNSLGILKKLIYIWKLIATVITALIKYIILNQ